MYTSPILIHLLNCILFPIWRKSYSICPVIASALLLLLAMFRFTKDELSNVVAVGRNYFLYCSLPCCGWISPSLKVISVFHRQCWKMYMMVNHLDAFSISTSMTKPTCLVQYASFLFIASPQQTTSQKIHLYSLMKHVAQCTCALKSCPWHFMYTVSVLLAHTSLFSLCVCVDY